MAKDVAEFLKINILETLKENEFLTLLSPDITTLLNDIKKELIDNEGSWSPPPHYSLSCFYELEYALAECQGYKHQTKTCLKRTFSPLSSGLEPDLKNMLSKIKEDLSKIRSKFEREKLLQMQDDSNEVDANSSLSPLTSSNFHTKNSSASYFPGFDEEITKKILELLNSNDKFKAIGIHGMCGTGKTTLVEEILNDPQVQSKYTAPIWVCLSDSTSEETDIRIVKEILLWLNDDPDLLTEEPEDDWLVNRLRDKLKGQKYLIVLDSVWYCNDWFSNLYVDEKDDKTKLPFSMALPKDTGGAIIVTSRVKEVTKKLVGEKNLIHLKPWGDEKIKGFVKQCMNSSSSIEGSGKTISDDKRFNDVVYHCHGLPLVAETLSEWIAEQPTKNPSDDEIFAFQLHDDEDGLKDVKH